MPTRRSFGAAAAASLLVALAAFPVAAQDWPSRPITIVNGFPAGAGTDVLARLIGEPLGRVLGQNVVVDNKVGAGGNIGSEAVAKARPDGYTLLLGTAGTHGINATLYKSLPFDVIKDFTPITLLADVPNILIVNKSFPATDVKGFIAELKANPGKYHYASTGNGASTHLAGERFKALAKVDIVHVPYRGTPPAMQSLLQNETQIMFQQSLSTMAQIKNDQVRPLGVTTETRIGALPNLPTVAEAGLPGYESSTWYGLMGPANMPRPIVDRLNTEVRKIMESAEFKQKLYDLGLIVRTSTPEVFAKVLADDVVRWREIVTASGAKVD
jgi:tripartite-type tricarboxylate transporter receptor subunit TctC